MKKWMLFTVILCALGGLTGCSDRLSNQYVAVNDYKGIELEKIKTEEVTEKDIDLVVDRMMTGYAAQNDLPEDTEVTDEIVREALSDRAQTVSEYRDELHKQIRAAKEGAAKEAQKMKAWEKVIDHSEVKEFPEERIEEVIEHLKGQYAEYAKEAGMDYQDYMKALKMDEKDLREAAEASVKQELVADVIAHKYGLKPTEADLAKALEDYAAEYKFTTVDLLLKAVPEEEMRKLVIQDNVKNWVVAQAVVK